MKAKPVYNSRGLLNRVGFPVDSVQILFGLKYSRVVMVIYRLVIALPYNLKMAQSHKSLVWPFAILSSEPCLFYRGNAKSGHSIAWRHDMQQNDSYNNDTNMTLCYIHDFFFYAAPFRISCK